MRWALCNCAIAHNPLALPLTHSLLLCCAASSSGALALWKEARLFRGQQLDDDWTAVAKAAFQTTAGPIPYPARIGTMWPTARVGASSVGMHTSQLASQPLLVLHAFLPCCDALAALTHCSQA